MYVCVYVCMDMYVYLNICMCPHHLHRLVERGLSVNDACDHLEKVRYTADCTSASTARETRPRESTRNRLVPLQEMLQDMGRKSQITVTLPTMLEEAMFQNAELIDEEIFHKLTNQLSTRT